MLNMLETPVRHAEAADLEDKSKQKGKVAHSLSSSSTMADSETEIASQLLDSDPYNITYLEEEAAKPSTSKKTNDNHNWKGINQYKNCRRCFLLLLEMHS